MKIHRTYTYMIHRLYIFLIVVFALGAVAARAERTYVSLLTCRPGGDIYELEGHSGLRINTPGVSDVVVNWGLFDFNSPNFVYRFVKGETDYQAGVMPTEWFVEMYRRDGRAVFEQDLALDSAETARLVALVERNLMPENRVYRYNYVKDNCATRPLAIVERAIGDSLRLGPSGNTDETFREVMRSFHKNYPWYQFGIDLALGSGVDYRISEREKGFAPELLAPMMKGAVRKDGRPIVKDEGYISGSERMNAVEGPTPWILGPEFVGWMLLAVSLLVSALQLVGLPIGGRIFDTVYYFTAGTAGLIIAFLIFVSVHEATSPNWLLLWLNPLCFIGVVATWLKTGKRLENWWQCINFALLIALTVIFLTGVQSPNPAFWPMIGADAVRSASNFFAKRKQTSV